MKDKILHLTLHKKFFKEILEGTKKIEYREIKSYWTKRLFNPNNKPIKYTKIIFKNGYAKDAPTMEVEFKGIRKSEDYEIKLGKILKSKNIKNLN